MDASDFHGRPRRKKWSPVDRMLMDRKSRSRVRVAPSPAFAQIRARVNQSTQTLCLPCTEGPCARELNEARKRIRDLRAQLTEKERALVAVPVMHAKVGPSPEPNQRVAPELAEALDKIAQLKKENADMKAELASARQEILRANKRADEIKEGSDMSFAAATSRQQMFELQTLLNRERDLRADAKKRALALEKQLKKQNADKDATMKRLEGEQEKLLQRVSALQRKISLTPPPTRGPITPPLPNTHHRGPIVPPLSMSPIKSDGRSDMVSPTKMLKVSSVLPKLPVTQELS
eukprot:GEMP01025189.1.p1 GENE.GEMP01025189.1~~GEMP01025189.1.p1  ORF type:complete len:291 (+),score=78.62 GEMP01025189.1:121-993(+)